MTPSFGGWCSIHLSYGRLGVIFMFRFILLISAFVKAYGFASHVPPARRLTLRPPHLPFARSLGRSHCVHSQDLKLLLN